MLSFIRDGTTKPHVIVTVLPDEECPSCRGQVGFSVKEEATLWKVYLVCKGRGSSCGDRRIGTISRSDVRSIDEVYEKGEEMVGDWV